MNKRPETPVLDRTRRIPRTAAEAFPHSTDYACALTRFDRSSARWLSRDEWVALACIVGLAVAAPFIWPAILTAFR